MKATDNKLSRYNQGGVTQIFEDRTGFWDRKYFQYDTSDLIFTLDVKYHQRPWMLAHDIYKDVSITWLILQFNNILDINEEFVAGRTIRVPTLGRLQTGLLTSNI